MALARQGAAIQVDLKKYQLQEDTDYALPWRIGASPLLRATGMQASCAPSCLPTAGLLNPAWRHLAAIHPCIGHVHRRSHMFQQLEHVAASMHDGEMSKAIAAAITH
jgi:hypothetical protein